MGTRARGDLAARVAALYARHARRYDEARSRGLMERPYLERAMALAPPPGEVLDLGCGSGEPLARAFIDAGYRVTGVDVVEAMLGLCRARFPEMTWRCADMRRLALRKRFRIVVAWDSFFHLPAPDQRAMFRTFRRHTAPGGVLLFTSGDAEGEAIGDLFGDELYHASLDVQETVRLLAEQGYAVVTHRVRDPECGGHTVWVARLRPDPADHSGHSSE